MQFLANENFPGPSIKLLRKEYKVISITEESPGITDEAVIKKAIAENLTILTFDRDYGEIIFKSKLFPTPSVIYFRFKGVAPDTAGKMLLSFIASQTILFDNCFTVIEEDSIRQRNYSI